MHTLGSSSAMRQSLPPGFVDIPTARSREGYANVIGVVVDVLSKRRSGGSSFVTTFTLKDSNMDAQSWDGLKVRFFNDNEAMLPDVQQYDVALLRSVRIRTYQGALIGMVSQWDKIAWAIFRKSDAKASPSPICSPKSADPSVEEKTYAVTLLGSLVFGHKPQHGSRDRNPSVVNSSSSGLTSVKQRKFSLIKDVMLHTYVDLAVHVIKTFPENGKFLLYVTDYTTNKSLFNYELGSGTEEQSLEGDEYGYIPRFKKRWKGPLGQMTLQVTLWEPHAYFARQSVKEDDIVFLNNVHIKLGRDHGRMDASIHTDHIYPEKIYVHTVDLYNDERVKALLGRKREYWKKAKTDNMQVVQEFGDLDDQHGGLRRSGKKNRQKQRGNVKKNEDQAEMATPFTERKDTRPNPHVKAQHPDIPCRSVPQIIENDSHNFTLPDGTTYRLPFQNLRYRATIHVVDFFPPKLEDFSVSYDRRYVMLSDSTDSGEDEDGESDEHIGRSSQSRHRAWEWRFCLVVEDPVPTPRTQPKERIKIWVSGHDAVHLLKLDATNLRQDKETLLQLREKLFILWGNLEERKISNSDGKLALQQSQKQQHQRGPTASARPFTCCIKEYGIKCRYCAGENEEEDTISDIHDSESCLGWEKLFALFGTTID